MPSEFAATLSSNRLDLITETSYLVRTRSNILRFYTASQPIATMAQYRPKYATALYLKFEIPPSQSDCSVDAKLTVEKVNKGIRQRKAVQQQQKHSEAGEPSSLETLHYDCHTKRQRRSQQKRSTIEVERNKAPPHTHTAVPHTKHAPDAANACTPRTNVLLKTLFVMVATEKGIMGLCVMRRQSQSAI